MGRYTKKDAIRIVTSCAAKYKENLVDRSLLFICQDKHRKITTFEFTFHKSNFLHLTGLQLTNRKWHQRKPDPSKTRSAQPDRPEISASDFYHKCLDHELRESDFEFAADGTTELKLDVLPALMSKNLSARMIGDFQSDKPRLVTEKLAGGSKACIGFKKDSKTGRYVPNTVIKADIRKHVATPLRVIACFRMANGDPRYGEATYTARDVDWDRVAFPDALAYLKDLCLSPV